jgi:hypothetical protein
MKPFRVMCIDGVKTSTIGVTLFIGGFSAEHTTTPAEVVYEGEPYTVILVEDFFGEQYYTLAERPITTAYNSKRFIPLSEIDEAEVIAEHEQEAIIYQR